jgi:hypothetical protein
MRAGLLAVSTHLESDAKRSRLRFSFDCGETWDRATQTLEHLLVASIAWTIRDGVPVLLVATRAGLFELAMVRGGGPLQIVVESERPDLALSAVSATTDARGALTVAVAAGSSRVYLSTNGGRSGTFRAIGLATEDVGALEMQHDGSRTFLWAGVQAPGTSGKGCFVHELQGNAAPSNGWRAVNRSWEGGSCLGFAFAGSKVFAATHRAGVLSLDSSRDDASWKRQDVSCGLPLRDRGPEIVFQPVRALAAGTSGRLLASAGPEDALHVYRSTNSTSFDRFEDCSTIEYTDKVTVPPTWLLCSGQHSLEVVYGDEKSSY